MISHTSSLHFECQVFRDGIHVSWGILRGYNGSSNLLIILATNINLPVMIFSEIHGLEF